MIKQRKSVPKVKDSLSVFDNGSLKEDGSSHVDGNFAYQILPQDVSKELLEMDVNDMQRKIREFFNLHDSPIDLRKAAILDYYTSAVWWAKEQGFTDQQMSGFFTAVHTLLENVKERELKLVDNVLEFKKMLAGIGTEAGGSFPSGGMEFFNVAQGQAITNYVFNSLFQHYRLYEYMFTQNQDEEIIGTDLDVFVAKKASLPYPPPLDEGIEEDKFEAFLRTPLPSPTPEPQEETGDVVEEKVSEPTIDLDAEVFSKLSLQDVREVVQSIADEMLGGLQTELAAKLREKENAIIAKINKIHHVAKAH